jgi:G3E family GTPase
VAQLRQRLVKMNPRAKIGEAKHGVAAIDDLLDIRGFNLNADMASHCQEAERIPLQLQMSLIPLPDGERDGACGCHP